MAQEEKQNEEIKNRLTCLDEIIAYMKDDKVTWRDVSDDIIIDILKKYNLYDKD